MDDEHVGCDGGSPSILEESRIAFRRVYNFYKCGAVATEVAAELRGDSASLDELLNRQVTI